MTTGAIIFAQNTKGMDYIKLAVFCADRINKFLDIPVSLITDNVQWLEDHYKNHNFDQIIEISTHSNNTRTFHDGTLSSRNLDWKNLSRSRVYELTPYDKTLVLDSDYVLNSSVLKPALDRDFDLQIYKNSIDLAGWRNDQSFRRINRYSIPFYWATVFIFQKNEITHAFFDLITYIKSEWEYFRFLYSIESSTYRNDFAFSIAIHIMNGQTTGYFATELPGNMSYILDTDLLINANDHEMQFLVEKEKHLGEYTAIKTSNLDVHVMNKYSLTRFIDGDIDV